MSFTAEVDRAYAATRLTREEERERECHRAGCDSTIDDTWPCDYCKLRFCPVHLYDGECAGCMDISDAADELIERQRRVA